GREVGAGTREGPARAARCRIRPLKGSASATPSDRRGGAGASGAYYPPVDVIGSDVEARRPRPPRPIPAAKPTSGDMATLGGRGPPRLLRPGARAGPVNTTPPPAAARLNLRSAGRRTRVECPAPPL